MILNGVNSDDYIYLRLLEENKYYPFAFSHLKKDTVLRFHVDQLRKMLWRNNVFQKLDCFSFEPNPLASKSDYEPSKLYSRVIVTKDVNLEVNMDENDILLINEWLWDKLNSNERPEIASNQLGFLFGCLSSKSPVERNRYHLCHTKLIRYDGTEHVGSDIFDNPKNDSFPTLASAKIFSLPSTNFSQEIASRGKIIDAYQFANSEIIIVPLKQGEVLDFNNPIINFLFLNQSWLRFLANVCILSSEEKLEYFKKDFEGWIPEAGRRYFKLHDYLKIHSLNDLTNRDVWHKIEKRNPSFQNMFYNNYWRYSDYDHFDYDSDGYLRYVWTGDEPVEELELEKIADRVSAEVGRLHYEHEVLAREQNEREKKLNRDAENCFKVHRKEFYKLLKKNPNLTKIEFMEIVRTAENYFKTHQKRFYKLQKMNPNLTPVQFMQMEEERIEEQKRVLVRRLHISLNKRIKDLESK